MSNESRRVALAEIDRAVFHVIVAADWRDLFRRPVHNSVTEQIRAAEKRFGLTRTVNPTGDAGKKENR